MAERRKIYPVDKIRAWHEARRLTSLIYRTTANFPASEERGMTAQLRRASTSIAANIAEGSRRETIKDFVHFLNIAEGSAAEVKTFLLLARDQEYLTAMEAAEQVSLADQVCSMLYSLREHLQPVQP